MFEFSLLKRIDFRALGVMLTLMLISIVVISSTTSDYYLKEEGAVFFTPLVISQIRAFTIGLLAFVLVASFDYRKLREWSVPLYILMLVLLVGLFFVPAIHNVRRWYRLPLIPFDIQPSEYAKLILVILVSWFLEKSRHSISTIRTFILTALLILLPFLLILKQPDLGTALILCPIMLVMFYLGGINRHIIKGLVWLMGVAILLLLSIFLKVIPFEKAKPVVSGILKEYQIERLNPDTYHQKAAQIAIGSGHLFGKGWRKSDFTGHKWLPYGYTDSVFPAFCEEFGLVGGVAILLLYFMLIFFSFSVSLNINEYFGRLLSGGISTYLAMHVLVNISMMIGLMPITGVPLLLISYGGSSALVTMMALGLLQSIYARRYTF